MSSVPHVDAVEIGPTARRARAEAFESFYLAEYPRLLALAHGLVGAAQAEDLAQDALLVACRRWQEVSQKERPDLWVRKVCVNLSVSSFRRRVRDSRLLARLASRPVEPATLPEPSDRFWGAVSALPARQAQAVALRYVYDMPLDEIARTMGCSDGSVKQHLSRARAALSVQLAVEEES